jgi:predicted Fe-Mo cluster-binding NifX family protein
MKVALPSNGIEIDSHFGHCEAFTVFTIDDTNAIVAEEIVPSPAGCGCKSNIAQTLAGMKVEFMLAGNMGEGAVQVLNNHGIEVVRGCSGNVKAVAQQWLEGHVADSGVGCQAHEHGCHSA